MNNLLPKSFVNYFVKTALLVLCLLGRFKCLTSPFLSLLSLFFQLSISFHHHPVQHHLSWSSSDTHKYNTRAGGGLSAQYARTNYRKFALGCRGPVIWNAIPPACIQALQPLRLFISSWKAHIN